MSLYQPSRRGFLRGSLATGMALAVPAYGSNEGLVSGRVKDMFSDAPYDDALVTLVNEDNGEAYQTRTSSLQPTAVEATSWADVKRMMRASASLKPVSTGSGAYSVLAPNGVYTVAITDGSLGSAKPSSGDLFNRQLQPGERFAPRVFRLRVNGDTPYDEMLVPKDFDFEFGWTVLSGRVVRYDYGNTTFYVDESPARSRSRPNPDGRVIEQWEINNAVRAIEDLVRLDTNGAKTPRIEIGVNPPGDVVPGYTKGPDGKNVVVPGYALCFWDSDIPGGAWGVGSPSLLNDIGLINSSIAKFKPGVDYMVIMNEVLGASGLSGEPYTLDSAGKVLDDRIVGSGGSIFLDAHGNNGEITERDAQIIRYHGQRPLNTRPQDITDRIVNDAV